MAHFLNTHIFFWVDFPLSTQRSMAASSSMYSIKTSDAHLYNQDFYLDVVIIVCFARTPIVKNVRIENSQENQDNAIDNTI